MIIQEIVLPKKNDKEQQELFFRGEGSVLSEEGLQVKEGKQISFDTYYNLFSAQKWTCYTSLSHLQLTLEVKGKMTLELFRVVLRGKRVVKQRFYIEEIDAKTRSPYSVEIPFLKEQGNLAFCLTFQNDGVLYHAAYTTKEHAIWDVKIAINMCTFQNTKYVVPNIELLNRKIFQSNVSDLKGHVKLYLVDNEKGGRYRPFQSENIFVCENPNTGGSGGFTKGMLMLLEKQIEYPVTHMILMDDDVKIHIEAIERNYAFLCFIKEKYKRAHIGGSILQMGKPYYQNKFGGCFQLTGDFGLHKNKDLRSIEQVLCNDREKRIQYFPWCYCCIPLECIRQKGLPFPLFVHHDDLEYAMRTAEYCIGLNGVGIEHKPNIRKRPSANAYYNVRNLFIVLALHKAFYYKWLLEGYLAAKVGMNLLLARYQDAWLNIDGTIDFMKGPDNLTNIICCQKHQEICKKGYDYIKLSTDAVQKKQKEGYQLFYIGQDFARTAVFHKKIMYVNVDEHYLCVKRDRAQQKQILRKLVQLLLFVDKNYGEIRKRYRESCVEMSSEKFWKKYLQNQDEEK